ncbi:hypothetical protein [uncultured Duncaniella sp.]|nr:hypothetical protein [uncultured Duncaniella sp.]
MSSLYSIEADNKLTAYVGMVAHFGGPGSFDKYLNEHLEEIRAAYETIKQL